MRDRYNWMISATFLVSMDVTSLYTNIPQEEGITVVCNAYENFHDQKPSYSYQFSQRNAQPYTDVYKTWTGVHGPPHGPGSPLIFKRKSPLLR